MNANGDGVSFGGDGNGLKLDNCCTLKVFPGSRLSRQTPKQLLNVAKTCLRSKERRDHHETTATKRQML